MHIVDFIVLLILFSYISILAYTGYHIKKGDKCRVLKVIFMFSLGYLILISCLIMALPLVLFN
jgi:hypothetical protein